MKTTTPTTESETTRQWRDLTPEEAREAFDRAAQYYLGISGDEFKRRWEPGEYAGIDRSDIIALSWKIPWAE
jgi:hypothetical protein